MGYRIEKRKQFNTAGDLKKLLADVGDDTKVVVCGDDYCWFHIEEDGSIVCLDCEELDEAYETDARNMKGIDIERIANELAMTHHQASEMVRIFDELKALIDDGNLPCCYMNSKLETTDDYIYEWEGHWHREASVEDFWFDEKTNYARDYDDHSVLETLEGFLDYWKNHFFEVRGEKMIFVVM